MKKNIYVVLGMARSGTSVIARGLNALGIDLGSHLTLARQDWNAKGFFEDDDVVHKINRRLMRALGYPWQSTDRLSEDEMAQSAVQEVQNAAVTLLSKRMVAANYWGFKDPRTARLLSFWHQVFATLNVNDHYVIALRNPLSSAQSYRERSGCDLEEALLLWLWHVVPAIQGTQNKKRVIVSYEMMLQDPHLQLNRIKLALDIPDLTDTLEVDSYVHSFLDKKLYHHENDSETLKQNKAVAVVPLCLQVYELLLRVASDEIQFSDAEFSTAWHIIMQEFNRMSPMYSYIDMQFKRHKQLQRNIRDMKKSFAWKLIYPIYMADNFFRMRRRQLRDKRRFAESYD